MKKNMDKVTFESRNELYNIINALDAYIEEHPKAEERRDAKRLRDLLDAMAMEW